MPMAQREIQNQSREDLTRRTRRQGAETAVQETVAVRRRSFQQGARRIRQLGGRIMRIEKDAIQMRRGPVAWSVGQRRLALGFAGILLVSVAFVVLGSIGRPRPTLFGTELDRRPAPGFTLTDHRGRDVSLSEFRGDVVVLTFIYTRCPDVCPIVAENLRVAYELLIEERQGNVSFLAVTVDPVQDTQQALKEFSAIHRWADNPNWFALRGDPETLERVWREYGIYPGMSQAMPDRIGTPAAGGGEGHTDGIYFIDPEGRERVFLRSSATPREIASNIEALLD